MLSHTRTDIRFYWNYHFIFHAFAVLYDFYFIFLLHNYQRRQILIRFCYCVLHTCHVLFHILAQNFNWIIFDLFEIWEEDHVSFFVISLNFVFATFFALIASIHNLVRLVHILSAATLTTEFEKGDTLYSSTSNRE